MTLKSAVLLATHLLLALAAIESATAADKSPKQTDYSIDSLLKCPLGLGSAARQLYTLGQQPESATLNATQSMHFTST